MFVKNTTGVTEMTVMSLMLITSYGATTVSLHSNKAGLLEDIDYGHIEQIQPSLGALKESPLELYVLVSTVLHLQYVYTQGF